MTDQIASRAQASRKPYARPMLVKREKLGRITALPSASAIITDAKPT